MLLTKKSEYALISLVSITKSTEPKNVDTLSSELNISKSFLAKVLQSLAKNGILISYKGNQGGFALNKKPEEISILEIVKIAEDKTPSVFECTSDTASCSSSLMGICSVFPILNKLQNKINDFLSQLTLKDVL